MVGPREPAIAECRFVDVDEREVVVLGRLRKARQALVLRHLSSSAPLMLLRYISSPFRLSSASAGEDVELFQYVLGGKGKGGAVPA